MQAWTNCEAAGDHYLSTYAALTSDDKGMDEDAPSIGCAAAVPCCKDLAAIISPVGHPLVYAEHVLLKVDVFRQRICKERLCPVSLAMFPVNILYRLYVRGYAELNIGYGVGGVQVTPGDCWHTWAWQEWCFSCLSNLQ